MKMMMLRTVLTLLLSVLLIIKTAAALSVPVTEYSLDNGLRIVVIEDHRAPVVLHAVVYDVGGADEAPGKTGLAHFFEHLMFKGTTKYPLGTIDNLMDENGVERNAFTTLNNTVYYERTSPALLDVMMDIEADRMMNLRLTTEILEVERKVVQEERLSRNESDPYGYAMEQLNKALFKNHPYGRPVIGLPEDVAKLDLSDALEFYRSHYMPSQAIVLVVGDVLPNDVYKLAAKHYGPLQNLVAPEKLKRSTEPTISTATRLELEDARITEPLFHRVYQLGSNAHTTAKKAAAFEVLGYALGSNWQSKLVRQLVTEKAIASSASASYGGNLADFGQFQISVSPRSGVDLIELEKHVDDVLRKIVENGVSAEELQDLKNAVEAATIYERDNPVGLGIAIGSVLAAGKKVSHLDAINAEIATLTPEDIQTAARMALNINTSVTLLLRPKN